MINKMEGRSGEMAETTDNQAKSKNEMSGSDTSTTGGDSIVSEISKEKNLLLLSALYYLCGEDWKESPDWGKVAEKIQELKIPVFGEDYTPEVCEQQYKLLIENGVQLGVENVKVVVKPPKRLTDSEKRLWMIAQLTTDIVRISKTKEKQMENAYRTQLRIMDMIAEGQLSTHESFEKEFRLPSAEDDPGDDPQFSDEFEDPDADIAATQLWQLEVMEGIVGMKDVLLLVRYCSDAAEYAVNKYASIMKPPCKEQPPAVIPEPIQTKSVDLNESFIIISSSDDDSVKMLSPIKPLQPETQTTRSEDRQSEASGKQVEGSPPKQSSKPSTRSNSRDSTPVEFISPVKESGDTSIAVQENPSPLNGAGESPASVTSTIILSGNSSFAEPNGDVSTLLQESLSKSDSSIEIIEEIQGSGIRHTPKSQRQIASKSEENFITPQIESTKYKYKRINVENGMGDVGAELFSIVSEVCVETSSPITRKKSDPVQEPEPVNEPAEPVKEPEAVKETEPVKEAVPIKEPESAKEPEPAKESEKVTLKSRASPRKSVGTTRKGSKRTSSRITSPEPSESPQNDDDKISKRTRGRHSSSSDTNLSKLPPIRRRRLLSPTIPVVDKEPPKVVTENSKPDVVSVEGSENETFETPRTTPESPEMKTTEVDDNKEVRPKTLKTYSVKPPSPLSQVDPKIFDEFIDDEDDPELAMIDNNVNKTKSDKVPLPKSTPKRGRTASSENASENNEESVQAKRITRRGGPNDDVDETPESTGQSSEDKSKRLTRSSLKVHDAANDEGADPSSRTGSEKAASESSFGGKEKTSLRSKPISRIKKMLDEKTRIYGDDDEEKTADGKRVTRARAKTGTSISEKRTKPSTTETSTEGGSESEPSPTRSTRSRASTITTSNQPEPIVVSSMPAPCDDEESKLFRKNALAVLEKLAAGDIGTSLKKFLDDPEEIVKHPLGFNEIKQRIESGKVKSFSSLRMDLVTLGMNILFSYHSASQAKETVTAFYKMLSDNPDLNELKHPHSSSSHKMDNSDVESLESHDESRGDITPKSVVSSGGRRKRRRSASETSEEVFLQESKRRVTRTSVSSSYTPTSSRKPKHPISPDIVFANRVRH